MFRKTNSSTTATINMISSAWAVLVIAILATTFTLYGQSKNEQTQYLPQLTQNQLLTPIY